MNWGSQEMASVDGADDDDPGSLHSTLHSNPSSGNPLASGLPPRRMKHSLSHLSGGRGSGLSQQGSGGRPIASPSDRRPSGVVGEFHLMPCAGRGRRQIIASLCLGGPPSPLAGEPQMFGR